MCSVILTLQHGSCTNYNHASYVGLPISFVVHAACFPPKDVEINGIVMCRPHLISLSLGSNLRGLQRFPNFTSACIYNSQGP